jgi:hypothetical protein
LPAQSESWSAESIRSQEAASNSRSEFSALAMQSSSGGAVNSFVVSGRVETGSESARYGAPETIAGEYDVDGAVLELDMTWDAESIGVYSTMDTLITGLKSELSTSKAPSGD